MNTSQEKREGAEVVDLAERRAQAKKETKDLRAIEEKKWTDESPPYKVATQKVEGWPWYQLEFSSGGNPTTIRLINVSQEKAYEIHKNLLKMIEETGRRWNPDSRPFRVELIKAVVKKYQEFIDPADPILDTMIGKGPYAQRIGDMFPQKR
jgi:hypothetical protein